jgi:glycosyltransferase involved in cell wall biosynthesis
MSTNSICIPSSHHYNKIILMLMIKNESKIIKRCIQSTLGYVDAISILDTGSTDNTIELCETFLATVNKPFKITSEPFKNFGHNRTISFECAHALCTELQWNVDTTYALAIDADMILDVSNSFKEYHMTANGYSIIQSNSSIKYYNTRFMRIGYPWKCIGATHEYWSGEGVDKIPMDVIYINDKNDGGCKHDKFERDIRLLTEEIENNPKNDRAHYYLGQSLKDTGKFNEAIALFKKRIELGGWIEEVHYSHYQIGKCYEHLNQPIDMEYWMNKAYALYPKKAEPFYHLTRYFREKAQHHKAYHYYQLGRNIPYPKDDLLFIEHNVYNGLFEYEATVLNYYISQQSKQDSLRDLISYLNKDLSIHTQNVLDNFVHYVEPLTSHTYHGTLSRLHIPDYEEFKASSCSILPYSSEPNKRFIVNARLVNYSIDGNGSYHTRSTDGRVKTKNMLLFLNSSYQVTDFSSVLTENYTAYPSDIEGLEDIRLFKHQEKLRCIASSKNATNDDKIVIICGDYDVNSSSITNIVPLEGPRASHAEKNWIYVPSYAVSIPHKNDINFIYGWHPLEIGSVDPNSNKLSIHTRHNTPALFRNARGSSPLVEYDGKLWGLIHFVKYGNPRIYYHSLVQFNRENAQPEQYSLPFYFKSMAIEYCIGLYIQSDIVTFLFSENDTAPSMLQLPLSHLRFMRV